MKTILFKEETTIQANGITYVFKENSYINKAAIDYIKRKVKFPYSKGGRFLEITPISDKDAQFIEDILNLNKIYKYKVISIN